LVSFRSAKDTRGSEGGSEAAELELQKKPIYARFSLITKKIETKLIYAFLMNK
jgi:hypothetical protein